MVDPVFPTTRYWDHHMWNILYDSVLNLDLDADATTVAFADLTLIVAASNKSLLMVKTNSSLKQISKGKKKEGRRKGHENSLLKICQIPAGGDR